LLKVEIVDHLKADLILCLAHPGQDHGQRRQGRTFQFPRRSTDGLAQEALHGRLKWRMIPELSIARLIEVDGILKLGMGREALGKRMEKLEKLWKI